MYIEFCTERVIKPNHTAYIIYTQCVCARFKFQIELFYFCISNKCVYNVGNAFICYVCTSACEISCFIPHHMCARTQPAFTEYLFTARV